MRGRDEQQLDVFSYVSPEQRVPQDHPLRSLRVSQNRATVDRAGEVIVSPPAASVVVGAQRTIVDGTARLLPASPRWFVGLNMDDTIWDVTVFHQEPRAPARWGRAVVFPQAAGENSLTRDSMD